jgi:hypothetical protein
MRENTDAAGQPGQEVIGGIASFTTPLGVATRGRLLFASGAAGVTLHAEPEMPNLYRATFARPIPRVWMHGATVTVQHRRFSLRGWLDTQRKPAAEIMLNGSIPWEIEVRGGVAQLLADLRHLQLMALDVNGVASDMMMLLARPVATYSRRSRACGWRASATRRRGWWTAAHS